MRHYEEDEDVAVFEAAVDELVDAVAGAAAGAEGVELAAAGVAVSFFSPVAVPPVSPPVLDGGLSLSE
ncbi:MAG: hypothetical protein MRJ68_10995 [Nitrospira sp.]|nr:hypothetical protein [Nitrospira sp.]